MSSGNYLDPGSFNTLSDDTKKTVSTITSASTGQGCHVRPGASSGASDLRNRFVSPVSNGYNIRQEDTIAGYETTAMSVGPISHDAQRHAGFETGDELQDINPNVNPEDVMGLLETTGQVSEESLSHPPFTPQRSFDSSEVRYDTEYRRDALRS